MRERECVKKKEALKVTLKAHTHTFIHGNAAEQQQWPPLFWQSAFYFWSFGSLSTNTRCRPTHTSAVPHTHYTVPHTHTHTSSSITHIMRSHTHIQQYHIHRSPILQSPTHTHIQQYNTLPPCRHTLGPAGRECGVCALHFPSVCPWVSRWKKTMRKHRGRQCGRRQSTLKTSLALLCGCLHTTKVSIRQSARITPRTDSDQVWNPPWTATTLKTNTKTPGGGDGVRPSASSSSHVQPSRMDSSPSTQVQTLTTDPD